jgi:peptidoglycan/LPS O-acetylase OafA/YrhL
MSPESTKPEQEKGRLLYVDGMRAGAALIVLINHVYQQVYWTVEPASRLGKKFAPLLQLGHWAVVVFIVLSGFCLMRPVVLSGDLKGGVKRFYIARALRILPAYWAAVALVLMLIATVIGRKHGIMYDVSLPVTAGGLLSHVLLLHNLAPPPYVSYSGNPEICSVFWTIALEWQIYFWFPLFVRIWQRWNAVTLVAGVGGILGKRRPQGTKPALVTVRGRCGRGLCGLNEAVPKAA